MLQRTHFPGHWLEYWAHPLEQELGKPAQGSDGEGEELGLGEGLGSGCGADLQAVQTDEQQDVALE